MHTHTGRQSIFPFLQRMNYNVLSLPEIIAFNFIMYAFIKLWCAAASIQYISLLAYNEGPLSIRNIPSFICSEFDEWTHSLHFIKWKQFKLKVYGAKLVVLLFFLLHQRYTHIYTKRIILCKNIKRYWWWWMF